MWLFAGLLAVPLIEIALFVTLGGWIGLWATLAIVIGTGFAGVAVIRGCGTQSMAELQAAARMRRNPLGQMADSVLIAFAGVLLILPGFLTDTLGLMLLIPPLRSLILRGLAGRVRIYTTDGPGRRGAEVIDGEYFEVDPPHPDRIPPIRGQH